MRLIDTDRLIRYIDADALIRYIDADALIRYIDANKYVSGNEKVFSEFDIVEMINNQPKAYDVDKVIEQIENELKESSQYGCEMEFRAGLYKALEIVKAGGKNEQID